LQALAMAEAERVKAFTAMAQLLRVGRQSKESTSLVQAVRGDGIGTCLDAATRAYHR
jgi:hypothetical protein